MSSFRRPVVVLRESAGTYTAGSWVAGTRSNIDVMASVQPLTTFGRDMQPLPEGRHLSDYVRLYTDLVLQVTADGEGVQPDIIVHQGYGYELIDHAPNQSGVINHYRYLGVKVFKFTEIADWLDGTLKRP